jgi:hypothetical protein
MTQLTRQPTGGRRKEGGLRIGEMERDSLISHGISGFIQESMMERSDKYRWQVCKKCGTIPNYSTKINSAYCPNCNTNETSIIETPYCMKLLSQELETMNVQMRFNCGHVTVPIEELELSASDNDDNEAVENEVIEPVKPVKPKKAPVVKDGEEVKPKRGRPKKVVLEGEEKPKRGRPKKVVDVAEPPIPVPKNDDKKEDEVVVKKKRGRPPKQKGGYGD